MKEDSTITSTGFDHVLCVITGPERSGTTLIEKIVCSADNIFSGFECGILLSRNFSNDICRPFNEWIYHHNYHWGLDQNHPIVNGPDFAQKYETLYKYKGSDYKHCGIQRLIKNSSMIVDKTPRYFKRFKYVHPRIPKDIPVIVTIKTLKEDFTSVCVKRKHITYKKFYTQRYLPQLKTLKYILSKTMSQKHYSNLYLFKYCDPDLDIPKLQTSIQYILRKRHPAISDLDINKYEEKLKLSGADPEPYANYSPEEINFPEEKYRSVISTEAEQQYNDIIDKLYEIYSPFSKFPELNHKQGI